VLLYYVTMDYTSKKDTFQQVRKKNKRPVAQSTTGLLFFYF